METTMLTKRKSWALAALTAVLGCNGTPLSEKVTIRLLEPVVVPLDEPDVVGVDSSIQEFAFRAAVAKLEPGTAYNVKFRTESETLVVLTFMPVMLDNPYYVEVRVSVDAGEPYKVRRRDADKWEPD